MIDLVVETAECFSLIDFRSFFGLKAPSKERLLAYAPQLTAYARSLEIALEKSCSSSIICLAAQGTMVDVRPGSNEHAVHAQQG